MPDTMGPQPEAIQVENAHLLAMFGEGERKAQESWKQRHVSLLCKRTRSLVSQALHRHAQCRGAMAEEEAQSFLTNYMVEWAFSELFHPTMRAQRMLRGVPQERREQAEGYHLYYLVAERQLAENTPKELRASRREERQIEALALAALWEHCGSAGGTREDEDYETLRIPAHTRLEPILLRLWLYRIQEVLKAWLREQGSREVSLELDQVEAASGASAVGPALVGQEGFDTSEAAALWRRAEKLTPLLFRDSFDSAIWSHKGDALTEVDIAQALNTERCHQTGECHEGNTSTKPWTRGRVAGRWNALVRRLRVLVLLLDQYAHAVLAPHRLDALRESWAKHLLDDDLVRFGQLPVGIRELLGVFHKTKNPHLLWVPLRFWLDGQSLQEMRNNEAAPGWDQLVQYWLMSRERLATEPTHASTVVGHWSAIHMVY